MKLSTSLFPTTLLQILLIGLLVAAPSAASGEGVRPAVNKSASEQQARKLIAELREELAPVEDQIRNHPFLDALEAGEAPISTLETFAVEEFNIIPSDLRSDALMVSRFGISPAGELVKGLLDGERIAFDLIRRFGAALGLDDDDLATREPKSGGQAFANAVVSLAAYGNQAEVAAAFLLNFGVFGENTARMSRALQDVYGFSAEDVEFFTFFGEPIPGFEEDALEIIAAGLDEGAEPLKIKRAARLLQEYELQFWNTVAEVP